MVLELKVTEVYDKFQVAFHSYDDDGNPLHRTIVLVGGSRSSKTYSILQFFAILLIQYKLKITVWRKTRVTCRSTVMDDFKEILSSDMYLHRSFSENKQNATFTSKLTGGRIIFEGADQEGKVLGMRQDISFFNEITDFNKRVYQQIAQRTSMRVICDYNPSKDFFLEKLRNDKRTKFIHSNFRNNSFCPPEIVEQLKGYEPWRSGTYEVVGSEVFFNGKPISKNNQPPPHEYNVKKGTASEFDWLVYGLGLGTEKPNRIFKNWVVIEEEEFDALEYQSYFGIDFGNSSPTAIVEVKFDGDNTFYIKLIFYKPLNQVNLTIPLVLQKYCKQIIPGESIIVCDSNKPDYISDLQQAGYMAIGAKKGSGSVERSITLIQGSNIKYVRSRKFTYEYDNYEYKLDKDGNVMEDPVKKDDHAIDASKYIITYLFSYLGIRQK